jgi:hypothetical protein
MKGYIAEQKAVLAFQKTSNGQSRSISASQLSRFNFSLRFKDLGYSSVLSVNSRSRACPEDSCLPS